MNTIITKKQFDEERALYHLQNANVIERIESRNGLLTLKHAEEIGLGTRWYQLTNID